MFYKKDVFKIFLQNSQENACDRASFLIKLQDSTPFLQSTSGSWWLVASVSYKNKKVW